MQLNYLHNFPLLTLMVPDSDIGRNLANCDKSCFCLYTVARLHTRQYLLRYKIKSKVKETFVIEPIRFAVITEKEVIKIESKFFGKSIHIF